MADWWVNQGSSFKASSKLGILWAPDADAPTHWARMRELEVGDRVVHFAKGIRAIGTVVADARPWTRPGDFKSNWPGAGLMVRVEYGLLEAPIPLGDIPDDLRSQQGLSGAFDKNRGVKQGYLWPATADLCEWVETRARSLTDQPERSEVEGGSPAPRRAGQRHSYSGPLDIAINTRSRAEQAALRTFLFGKATEAECALCARLLPVPFLRAAHIKPRSSCSDDERRDFRSVAMPACILGCDALFELGWVAVDDGGSIEMVGELSGAIEQARSEIVGRACKAFSDWTAPHFAWHRSRAHAAQLPLSDASVRLLV